MAGTPNGPGSGSGNIPPRPGGKRPVPKRPTGKPPANFSTRPGRPPQQKPGQQRASARQAVQQRRQRNIYIASGSVALVVVVVAVLITAKLAGGGSSGTNTNKKFPSDTFALTSSLTDPVEHVPVKSLIKYAEAALAADRKDPSDPVVNAPYKINGKSLTSAGKPEALFIGAEYCPYCAAERWSLVMALSQFGSFSGLRGTTSSATDVNASTPTFSFYNANFTSDYVNFTSVEEETNTEQPLQDPTAAESAIAAQWDAPPYTDEAGSIPFLYIDGKYLVTGLQYGPSVAGKLSGQSFPAAASYLTSGTNKASQYTEAAAGFLVGDICTLTHNQPPRVCSMVPADLKGVNAESESKGSSPGSTSTTQPRSSAPTTTKASKPTTTKASS